MPKGSSSVWPARSRARRPVVDRFSGEKPARLQSPGCSITRHAMACRRAQDDGGGTNVRHTAVRQVSSKKAEVAWN